MRTSPEEYYFREVNAMGPNKTIGCVVTECRYHAKTANYCGLEHIDVSKTASTADAEKDTECATFEKD